MEEDIDSPLLVMGIWKINTEKTSSIVPVRLRMPTECFKTPLRWVTVEKGLLEVLLTPWADRLRHQSLVRSSRRVQTPALDTDSMVGNMYMHTHHVIYICLHMYACACVCVYVHKYMKKFGPL